MHFFLTAYIIIERCYAYKNYVLPTLEVDVLGLDEEFEMASDFALEGLDPAADSPLPGLELAVDIPVPGRELTVDMPLTGRDISGILAMILILNTNFNCSFAFDLYGPEDPSRI